MKLKAQSRVWMALAALGGAFMAAQPVMAQSQLSNLFANASPSVRDRMFMRLDYIRANVKTTAGDVQDVTGPVVTVTAVRRLSGEAATAAGLSLGIYGNTTGRVVAGDVGDATTPEYACEASGLGTPCGVRAKSQTMIGTPALSVGYFLNDDFSWAVEAFVLAKPIDITIQGDGANHLNSRDIIKLKFLPPTVSLSYFFGDKKSAIRPFVGLLGSYAIFYDTRATDYLNAYQGGGSPGDTSIKVNNTLGWGGLIGVKSALGEDWSFNLSVGKLRYKTDTKITTRNTVITKNSIVLQDYGPGAQHAFEALDDGRFNLLMCKLSNARLGTTQTCTTSSNASQGTFVRKASNVLDSTLFVLSVGRSF